MHAGVFAYHTHAPTHSHIPTFQQCVNIYICIYIYDGIKYCVCKYLPTHIYCESERKYPSVLCVLGITYGITMYAGLFG